MESFMIPYCSEWDRRRNRRAERRSRCKNWDASAARPLLGGEGKIPHHAQYVEPKALFLHNQTRRHDYTAAAGKFLVLFLC